MLNDGNQSVVDAPTTNWVDRHAPVWSRPYLRLARADRPIGTWLLLLPGWWGIALAGAAKGHSFPNVWLLLLFAIGAFVMRGAGCTYNDIVDRQFDAQVERTRSRPIPSGQVSVAQAWAFLVFQCLIGLAVLLVLSPYAIGLGIVSLGLIAVYPFMKRFTYWPQIWLGLTFNWGVLMGWAAVYNGLNFPPIFMYLAGLFWTLGYDTIYAHQDKEDDLMIGVKSSALKLGEQTRPWLASFYTMTVIFLGFAGLTAGLGILFFAGLALAIAHLIQQIRTVDIDSPEICLSVFKSNRDFGAIIFAAILADMIL